MVGISVKNFSIAFGETQILENINFEVKAGEIFTILGPSGCGKSTILRSIASLQDNFKGEILLNETCDLSKSRQCNKDIGYIFQDYALFPHLNVQDNIAFALDKLNKQERQRRLDKLLNQFDLFEHRHKQIHELSGGQQQRVSIARVIAYEPKVLLLDEPFSNLDSILRTKTKVWLKNLIKELGLSAILVTHDQKEALSMSDKIAIINDKTIIQTGTPSELFNYPNCLYVANFLSDTNILPKAVFQTEELNASQNQQYIIRVHKTFITQTINNCPLIIEGVSYCGEYLEMELYFKEYPNYTISIRENTHYNYKEGDMVYLEVDKKDIIVI
jgi:ABC-type Fe3+/spermidine/putrescine transport system ATPase subunit